MDDLVLMRLLNKYRKNHINVYAGLRLTACDASAPRLERRAAQAVLSDPRSFERFLAADGGKGSGNFGHKGRPGQVGGSGGGGGSSVSSSSAKANRKSLDTANKKMSSECTKRAQQWPAGSQERHVYEMYAQILSDPLPERPTKQESDALTQKFLSNISSQLQPYAVERYKRDLANEPQITADLCDIADEVGAGMFGLGYRLKKASDSADGGCRIADKIQENILDARKEGKEITYEQAVDQLSDMVRYTQACTPENLVGNFEATREALEQKGYKPVKIKNTWDSYNIERPYRGVNCVFESPTGTKFELQFHTAESLVGKEVQHGQYEEQRDPRTAPARKKELGQMMYNNMSGMSAPKDIGRIKKYP